ncbi:hypothetical protein MVEN_01854300 [Mycena venus]|uniref:DUF6535 domain-containing protein n=1 Tax=Mycena venus TaxID=2733690 RepID=A0A8H6XGQ9_9AGAR|nr:hypothetical protein MVEN_01854300 [Mycena venus]
MDVEQKGESTTNQAVKGKSFPTTPTIFGLDMFSGDEAAAAKLWAVYISEAEKYDKGLVESWKSDMEGMLIFAGLFSASLTAFLIESYKTLIVDSGDATVQLLTRISQQLEASANGSTFPIPPPIDMSFTPTTASVVCNALWFISLGLSLTCALIATPTRAMGARFPPSYRNSLRPTHSRSDFLLSLLRNQAVQYAHGSGNNSTPAACLALLLFLRAHRIPHPRQPLTYSVLTFLPLRYFDCPYRTPLSGVFWRLLHSYQKIWYESNVDSEPEMSHRESMVETMSLQATVISRERALRDGRALIWTVKSLSDDSELEAFIEAIPDVLWGSESQRYSYANHIRDLIKNLDVQLCDRIENHLRSCDTGILPLEARKRRLIASYKALWAIATLFHPKQFPGQPPLDFSRWTRFFQDEDEDDILHYSLSAQVLMQWSLFSANETRATEMLPYLAKCRMDIEHGHEPDERPIVAFLNKFPWVHPVPFRVRKALKRKLTLDAISGIESMIGTYRCNIRLKYFENAAELDSIPYRWRETLQLIELPEFIFSKCERALRSTLNTVIHGEFSKFNIENVHWIDDIVVELFRLWNPTDSATVIPSSIITYLNARTTVEPTVWRSGIASSLWSCFPNTLSDVKTRHVDQPGRKAEEKLLTAMWRLASFFPFAADLAVYSRALDALANTGCPAIAISLGALAKARMVASLSDTWTDENWQSRFSHSLLPTETAVVAPDFTEASQLSYDRRSNILAARTAEGGIDVLAQFLESCASDPFPYKAVETIQKMDLFNSPVSVHDVHQDRLSQALGHLFKYPPAAKVLPLCRKTENLRFICIPESPHSSVGSRTLADVSTGSEQHQGFIF